MHDEMHIVICLTGRCGVPGALPLSYAGLLVTQMLMHLCDVVVVVVVVVTMPPAGIDPAPFF